MRSLFGTLFLLAILPGQAPAQPRPTPDPLSIGKVDSIWSGTLKERRQYLVYTPPSYSDTTYLPRKYPVLYLLDGDAHFHSVTGLIQILGTGVNGTFVVPEMIVVAIPNTDRTRDLTPTRVTAGFDGKPAPFLKTSGGMGNFFTFIKSELIPEIESKYRTAPYRMFVGHSLGGITTINALYTTPETFNSYVAIDPSLWYDDRLLLKKAKAYFTSAKLPNKALFVGQANTINPDDTTSNVHYDSIVQFNSILESYNSTGLRYGYKLYSSDDHGSVPLIAEYDALHFIFASYKASLTAALDRPGSLTEHYAKVSASMGYEVLPPEFQLDLLGQINMSRDTTKAIEAFRMAADLYPTSPHAHASLAGAWQAKGDTKKAMAEYERTLALKPGDANAKAMIEKLKAAKP